MLYKKIPKNLQIHISLSATSDINFHRRQKKKDKIPVKLFIPFMMGVTGHLAQSEKMSCPQDGKAIRALVIIRLSYSVFSAKKEEQ